MRRIKFVKELGRRQGQGAGPEYKAGDVHEFSGYVAESYAQAYIDRGYAVDAPAPIPKPETVPYTEVEIGLSRPVTMTSSINKPVLHKAAQEYGKRK